jgi:hypothetical protein
MLNEEMPAVRNDIKQRTTECTRLVAVRLYPSSLNAHMQTSQRCKQRKKGLVRPLYAKPKESKKQTLAKTTDRTINGYPRKIVREKGVIQKAIAQVDETPSHAVV